MSKYKRIKTTITNLDLLSSKLTELGVDHQLGGELAAQYRDQRGQNRKVDLRLTGRLPGLWSGGEIGFAKAADGTYELVCDDIGGRVTQAIQPIMVAYQIETLRIAALQRGYQIEEREADGVTRLILTPVAGGHSIEVNLTGDELQATVQGIQGDACSLASQWLNALGQVTDDSPTDDYFAAPLAGTLGGLTF